MTESQRLQIKMSETRVAANDETISAEDRTRLLGELRDLEVKFRTVLEAETSELANASFRDLSPEALALVERADVGAILSAVADHRMTDGAERELQSELRVAGDVVPWALLEQRAAATFTANTGQAGVGGYVGQAFADSIAQFVGCNVVFVPSGEQDYPILSTGASVEHQTASAGVAETTAAFTVEKLTPRNRYQAGFAVREQDLISFAGAGAALGENLRSAVRDRLDQDLMTRATEGLFTVKTGANPTTPPPAATTYAQYLAAMFGAVDGIHAGAVNQTRLVVDRQSYAHMGTVLPTNGNQSAAEKIGEIAQVRVTPHASSGTNYRDAVVAKMAAAPNAVMALFGGGIRVLEDPYTRAAEGERRFHGVLFGDFSVLRAAAYDRHRFRVS